MENPKELAIAHAVTEEEVLSYLAVAISYPLLVKQACLLRDRAFSHREVQQWLMHKVVDAPISAGLLDAISLHLSNL